MSIDANEWRCSHPDCSRDKPYCLERAGIPVDPNEQFTFTNVSGTDIWLCQNMIRNLELHRSLMEDDDEGADDVENALSAQEALLPTTIAAKMKDYIAGQDMAMKAMGTFLYREAILKPRLRNNPELMSKHGIDEPDVRKSIALMFGSTGSGKTLTIELAERLYDMPVSLYGGIKNVTSGAWVGTKIEQVFMHLVNDVVAYYQRRGDPKSPQDVVKGINTGNINPIFALDEIDKIALKSTKGGANSAVAQGEDQQSMLLTYLEDATVDLGQLGSLRTRNIVFVMMGAFSTPNKDGNTLAEVIQPNTSGYEMHDARAAGEKRLNDIYARAEPKHFHGWFIDQFVGRISYLVPFMTLDMATLRAILSESKGNPVSEMLAEIELLGGELIIQDEALDEIARRAYESNTGARALVRELEGVLREAMYFAPEKIREGLREVYVSLEMVESNGAIITDGENTTFRPSSRPTPDTANAYPMLPVPTVDDEGDDGDENADMDADADEPEDNTSDSDADDDGSDDDSDDDPDDDK